MLAVEYIEVPPALEPEGELLEPDTECKLCYGRCHGPTHRATERVYRALRERMKKLLAETEPPKPREFGPPAEIRDAPKPVALLRQPIAVPILRQTRPAVAPARQKKAKRVIDCQKPGPKLKRPRKHAHVTADRIVELERNGMNIAQVAAELRVKRHIVHQRLRESGIRKRERVIDQRRDAVLVAHSRGLSTRQISAEVGVDKSTVNRIVRKAKG